MDAPSYDEFLDSVNLTLVFERMDADVNMLINQPNAAEIFTAGHIRTLMHQLLLGLKHMKQSDILHRDL